MKINLPAVVLAAFVFTASAFAGPIALVVQEKGSRETDKKDKFKTTQEKQLIIKLSNNSATAMDGLKVKYSFHGKNVIAKTATVISSGEKTVSIPARGTVTVESDKATASAVEKHTEKKTQVPASGEKLTGYSVQVFNGTDLVGETYSSQDIKQSLAGDKH